MPKKKKLEDISPPKDKNSGYIRPLPSLELKFYLAVHVAAVAYICYSVFVASKEYDGLLNVYEFEPGWKTLGREKDISNFEWHFFYQLFWKVWPWMVGHVALSKIVEWNFSQYRRSLLLIYSLSVLIFLLGWRTVCLFVSHCVVIYLISLGRSLAGVWIGSFCLLTTLNLEQFTSFMKSLNLYDDEGHYYYLLMFTLALAQLRYTSFCLEACREEAGAPSDSKKSFSEHYSFIDMLFYVFYFPLFFTGPLLTYNQFQLQTVNLWALAGVGYCSGQFFMTKYTVMFGLPANIARIDHLDPPPGPKCVAHIYLYSDMWKYFDCGMYNFIKRYIYVPIGGSRTGKFRQFIGSFVCFCFVYYWHGIDFYVFIWSVLNFIGVSLEVITWTFLDLPAITKLETEILSPSTVRRLHALVAIPFFIMSAFTAFCFFGGQAVGYTFFQRYIIEGTLKSWTAVIIIIYCCVQIGMEVKRRDLEMIKQKLKSD